MAIVKPIKVRRSNLAGLRGVIDYIKDGEKTQDGVLVYMKNGLVGNEFKQMVIVKELYGKTTGRQYTHFVQSFDERDEITPELAFKIGREYIDSLEKWNDFQVLMAVHTDQDHMHIHYIINSVNSKDGSKWQCSKQDLKHFREQSDVLCRKYHLGVIERGNRGHRSYGEYTANQKGASWKAMLAADVADCLQYSKSKPDFLHRLDKYGIDADFGNKNIMFTIEKSVYGLDKEVKCSNFKLMSYGDFSKQNIENYFRANKGILQLAFEDMGLMQDAFLEVGKILFPNNPTELQDRYFGGMDYIDFDALTREEIEAYLKHKKAQQLQLKAWAQWDKQSQGGQILSCIADTLEEIIKLRQENQLSDYFTKEYDYDNEYEL